MWTVETIVTVVLVFLVAGFVKGVIGLGLPTVSLALLTATLGLKNALALLLIPSFATNFWQAVVGGALAAILKRFWSLLAAVCIATWFGVGILARSDAVILSGLLGLSLAAYAISSLANLRIPAPGKSEAWLSPVVGAVNGFLTGLTGSFVVPGVMYLQALGLSRDVLIQAMGVLFTVSTVALAVALNDQRLLSPDAAAMSLVALVPSLLGMVLGQRLRHAIPESRFRQVFFGALLLLSLYIAAQTLVAFR